MHTFEHANDWFIAGAPLRTAPETAARDIPAHWGAVMASDALARLPRRPDDPAIYTVYCDYERDHLGPYTMVLGVAVDPAWQPPGEIRRVAVPRGRYASVAVEGDPARIIWQAWAFINEAWGGRATRRYAADYERYPLESLGRSEVRADIAVGVR